MMTKKMSEDLFGDEILPRHKRPLNYRAVVSHAQLIKIHGKSPGNKCGDCALLYHRHLANTYYKCKLAPITRGIGTDWRKRWQACGKFKPETNEAIQNHA